MSRDMSNDQKKAIIGWWLHYYFLVDISSKCIEHVDESPCFEMMLRFTLHMFFQTILGDEDTFLDQYIQGNCPVKSEWSLFYWKRSL